MGLDAWENKSGREERDIVGLTSECDLFSWKCALAPRDIEQGQTKQHDQLKHHGHSMRDPLCQC